MPLPRTSLRADERRIRTTTWQRISHTSVYRNAEASLVWAHGDIYYNATKPRELSFICDYCNAIIKPSSSRSTGNYRRHYRNIHGLDLSSRAISDNENDTNEDEEDITISERPLEFSALTIKLNIDRWRMLLVKFVVECQVPFNIVEQSQFRELLLYSQPSLKGYFISSRNSVKNWVTQ